MAYRMFNRVQAVLNLLLVHLSSSVPCFIQMSRIRDHKRDRHRQTQTQIVKCLCCCGSWIHVKNSENRLTFTTNIEARKTVNLPRQPQQMPKKLQL